MGWTDFILPAVIAGGSYMDYRDKKKRSKDLNRRYEQYRAAHAAAQAAKGSGGGGGGRGDGGKGAMRSTLSDYYGQANALLQPYVDMAKEQLPKQAAAFNMGMQGVNQLGGMVLSPEFLRQAIQMNTPQQAALPGYLVGGGK